MAPRISRNCLESAPRATQDRKEPPKRHQEQPSDPHEAARVPQGTLQGPLEAAQGAQMHPQGAPKEPQRRPRDLPKRARDPQHTPGTAENIPGTTWIAYPPFKPTTMTTNPTPTSIRTTTQCRFNYSLGFASIPSIR